jgi:hypothetical protein
VKHFLATLLFATGCNQPVEPPAPDPASSPEEAPDGWGAVFWRGPIAWKVGGGSMVVGPRSVSTSKPRDETTASAQCGGVAIDDAVPHAVLALPEGKSGATPEKPAVIAAAAVEAAAWRLDELLPARDRFSPATSNAEPASQRGVSLGSVVKLRRYGGPPVLVVGGSRDCTGVLAVLDRQATKVLASTLVEGLCGTPRVLPPADIDGDGQLETALFSDTHVLLARIPLTASVASITPVHTWSCPMSEQVGG